MKKFILGFSVLLSLIGSNFAGNPKNRRPCAQLFKGPIPAHLSLAETISPAAMFEDYIASARKPVAFSYLKSEIGKLVGKLSDDKPSTTIFSDTDSHREMFQLYRDVRYYRIYQTLFKKTEASGRKLSSKLLEGFDKLFSLFLIEWATINGIRFRVSPSEPKVLELQTDGSHPLNTRAKQLAEIVPGLTLRLRSDSLLSGHFLYRKNAIEVSPYWVESYDPKSGVMIHELGHASYHIDSERAFGNITAVIGKLPDMFFHAYSRHQSFEETEFYFRALSIDLKKFKKDQLRLLYFQALMSFDLSRRNLWMAKKVEEKFHLSDDLRISKILFTNKIAVRFVLQGQGCDDVYSMPIPESWRAKNKNDLHTAIAKKVALMERNALNNHEQAKLAVKGVQLLGAAQNEVEEKAIRDALRTILSPGYWTEDNNIVLIEKGLEKKFNAVLQDRLMRYAR